MLQEPLLGAAVPGWPRRRALKGHVWPVHLHRGDSSAEGQHTAILFCARATSVEAQSILRWGYKCASTGTVCKLSAQAAALPPYVSCWHNWVTRMPLLFSLVLFCWTDLSHLL